jgi:hypothetical protein
MLVAFTVAGVNTFHLDLKGNFTVIEVVGIKKKGPFKISETTLDFGIDVIDAEIKVCMFLINFPGTHFGIQW